MRASSQSSNGSITPTSPTLLYAHWSSTNGHSPGSSSSKEEDYVDDDLFGSAAWRQSKRRGTGKRGQGHSPGRGGGQTEDERSGSQQERVTRRWRLIKVIEHRAKEISYKVISARLKMDAVLAPIFSYFTAPAGGRKNSGSEEGSGAVPSANGSPRISGSSEPGCYELTSEALAQQTRLLCGNYIFQRLSAKGLMSKRVRVAPHHSFLADELWSAGLELERLYPRIYNDVSRRISMTMTSAQIVRRALTAVLEGIFRSGVTWAKVVSMVAIAAAFAEECVVQGHPNFVEDVVMCVGHFVTLNLTGWMAKQGGWASFPTSRPPIFAVTPVGTSPSLALAVIVLVVSLVVFLLSRVFLDVT